MITEDRLEQLAIQWFQGTAVESRPWRGDCAVRRGGGAWGFPDGGLEAAYGGGGAVLEPEAARIRGGGGGARNDEAGTSVALQSNRAFHRYLIDGVLVEFDGFQLSGGVRPSGPCNFHHQG
ncbi:hypothetical protein JIN85_18470 [Luteolibacter pohnpeiensis]|uniref:Uncharacterized protein n=1 Tax=Luteolibacter pohnpeiensis TaxID=454153 RepID=A0A934VY10_9BACT|nr:hypothetical protein [Luteolibacter pohnpeiensis]MBK1884408.1 hypothetical protein [Luteolibacter pohnpeiensis]